MDPETARERMVDRLGRRPDVDSAALAALRAVPRHEFVPDEGVEAAYADRPVPIGDGQTASAPSVVGLMCSLLEVEAGDDVVEVGTGCGYHAAVTAELVAPGGVYSVEYDPDLAADARDRLSRLGYDAVRVRVGDGREGWPEHAPYDAAYLTCAAPEIPDPVVDQVREGGRVVAPVDADGGRLGGGQRLVSLRVDGDGVEREDHGGVRFVPMRGGDGEG
ncbi:protein-L-isoaspartate(D-aspartate) O-methyltransferase [Halobaculum magnesiiphilum]|uniref:Protein-L-isoaspartate O-methyltransferase n=1 Tax=Halobaculum magnesiiphilum TaxID=1017351 RepID=A0A8T8WBE0_9EURY|nr:protein-L-isoaspartate(D-aspartate) O-methyltransferase [Halobaculum magnesiiphilum]QZP37145.1 protein-L-isoaspartate(D-aspartate) O-methyltransferase [Halobaculum magnesiiphilum]